MTRETTHPIRNIAAIPTAVGVIARLAVGLLDRRGIDPEDVIEAAGLTRELVFDDNRISAASQMALLNGAAKALGDDWIGLTLAADVDLRKLGVLYYVAASADRLGEAFRRLDRYLTIANEGLDLHVGTGEDCRIGVSYTGIPRHADRHQAEFLSLVILRLCRQLVGRSLVPAAARFVHHRSGNLDVPRRLLGCEPEFDAPSDEVCFPAGLFDTPLVGADPFLSELMVKACEEALARRPQDAFTLRAQVENAIAPLLPHAEARAARIARTLGLSERTLSRRLKAEGLSFDQILDALRRDLAIRYLEDPSLPISQIAWLLGFHQPSTFSHACRRWTGRSPIEQRRHGLRARDGLVSG